MTTHVQMTCLERKKKISLPQQPGSEIKKTCTLTTLTQVIHHQTFLLASPKFCCGLHESQILHVKILEWIQMCYLTFVLLHGILQQSCSLVANAEKRTSVTLSCCNSFSAQISRTSAFHPLFSSQQGSISHRSLVLMD